MEKNPSRSPENGEPRLADIQTIKEILLRTEKKHLIEPWSYFVWGISAAVGGIAHFVIQSVVAHPSFDYFLFIWIPVFCVGGFFETAGFIKRMARESLPLLSNVSIRLFLGFAGICVAFAVIVLVFLRFKADAFIPSLIDLFVGICFIGYAILSAPSLFLQAFFCIIAGVILFVFQIPAPYSVLTVSLTAGAAFIWAGFNAGKSDQK